jgi:hypothetical protein
MLSRLADPYKDAEFSANELPALAAELGRVLRTLEDPPDELREVVRFVQEARERGHAIKCAGD